MSDARITQEAADWHARLRSPSLTEADKTRFRTWLAGSPAHQKQYDAITAMWNELSALADSPEVLAELQRAEPVVAAPTPPVARGVSRRTVIGWALAASVVATVGIVVSIIVIVGTILFYVLVFGSLLAACNGLEPGVYDTGNGGTLTCG